MRWLKYSIILLMPLLLMGWQQGGVCDDVGCRPYEEFDSLVIIDKLIVPESAPFIMNANIDFEHDVSGGSYFLTGDNYFYRTNGVDDEMRGKVELPYMEAGGTVIIDSIFMSLYTQGNEDSVHVFLREYDIVGAVGYSDVDSVWYGGGSSGLGISANVLQHGDYTVKRYYPCTFLFECINNGTTDIQVHNLVTIIYHLE